MKSPTDALKVVEKDLACLARIRERKAASQRRRRARRKAERLLRDAR